MRTERGERAAKHKESGESPFAGVQDAGQIAALEPGRSRRGAVEESGACLPSQHFGALRQGDRSAQARHVSFPPPIVSGAHVLFAQNKTKSTRHVSPRYRYDRLRGSPREHPRPIMLQLPLVPAYALTVHKTQAVASGRAFGLYLHCLFVAARTHARHAYLPSDVSPARR